MGRHKKMKEGRIEKKWSADKPAKQRAPEHAMPRQRRMAICIDAIDLPPAPARGKQSVNSYLTVRHTMDLFSS